MLTCIKTACHIYYETLVNKKFLVSLCLPTAITVPLITFHHPTLTTRKTADIRDIKLIPFIPFQIAASREGKGAGGVEVRVRSHLSPHPLL